MSRLLDNVSNIPYYHGSRVERLPVKELGNYHAVEISRTVIAAPVTAYTAILGKRAALTALIKYSDDFSQSQWTKTNATGTAAATTDPEGGTSCSKLAESNANGAHNASQALVVAAGLTGFGVIMKASERSNVRLRINNGTDGNIGIAVFNLSTGVLVSGSGTIKPLRNGWWWCYVTATTTVTNSTCFVDLSSDGSTFSYTGTTGSGVFVFHATAYLCTTLGSAFYPGAPTMGPALYTAAVTRAVSTPAVDPDDPIAFLMDETEPQPSAAEYGVAIWQRRFNHVPRQTTVPSSQFITKPGLTGTFPQVFGTSLVLRPDENAEVWDFYSRIPITVDSGPLTDFYPTGGSYTLTFEGSTTSGLDYNVSALQVQTALNALTPISDRGGVVVVGAYNSASGFTITFNPYAPAAALNTGSLTTNYGTIASSIISAFDGFSHQVAIFTNESYGPAAINGSLTPANLNPIQINGWDHSFTATFFSPYPPADVFAVAGSFTLTVFGQTTSAINWVGGVSGWYTIDFNASSSHPAAVAVAAAINALANVSSKGGYTVTYGAGLTNNGGIYTQQLTLRLARPVFNGGTFTITMFGQTTSAIAYNATLTTIQTALNTLSNISSRGGCIVVGNGSTGLQSGNTNIGFTIQFPNQSAISVANSLTPAGSTAIVTKNALGTVQTIKFGASTSQRLLTAVGHGFSNADTIYLLVDGDYVTGIVYPDFEVIDAATIRIPVVAGSIYATALAITYTGKKTTSYNGGVKLTRIKRVTDFYLPGITVDVNTVDDIPLPTWQGDDVSLLNAILTGSSSINYEVGDMERWRSDIVARTLTTLNASTL
jgi:hypothetical protein